MAYDGKVMREALQRFEEDKQRRASQAAVSYTHLTLPTILLV